MRWPRAPQGGEGERPYVFKRNRLVAQHRSSSCIGRGQRNETRRMLPRRAGPVPPMLPYWDQTPIDDPFYQAVLQGIRLNRIAAALTGASVLSGAAAMPLAAVSASRGRAKSSG